jgi:hypothetical protein
VVRYSSVTEMNETPVEPSGSTPQPSGSTPEDDRELTTLRYNEAVSSIESQRNALGELRARTGLLISAASISTAFLGSVAAKGHPGFPLHFLWAIIPLGVSIGLALLVLVPWPGWRFSLRSKTFLAFKGKKADEAVSELADILDSNALKNQRRVNIMSLLFAVSTLALLWSIIAWIVVTE